MSVEKFLSAIRAKESNNNYTAQNNSSSASGAYQFIDSTWKGLGGLPAHAKDATAEEQDRIALKWATQLLKKYNNDYHKAARAWKEGENVVDNDSNAGKAYADDIVQRMNR